MKAEGFILGNSLGLQICSALLPLSLNTQQIKMSNKMTEKFLFIFPYI